MMEEDIINPMWNMFTFIILDIYVNAGMGYCMIAYPKGITIYLSEETNLEFV